MSSKGQQLIESIKANNDLDIYDKSGFLRYRLVPSETQHTVRIWHNGNCIGHATPERAADEIDKRIAQNLSEESDYKLTFL